jgi:hypothetical protein
MAASVIGILRRVVIALFRVHLAQELAVDRKIEVALRRDVIRAFHGFHAVEGEVIAGDIDLSPGAILTSFSSWKLLTMVTPTTKTAMPMWATCMPKKLRGCFSAAARKDCPARVCWTRVDEVGQGRGDDPGCE